MAAGVRETLDEITECGLRVLDGAFVGHLAPGPLIAVGASEIEIETIHGISPAPCCDGRLRLSGVRGYPNLFLPCRAQGTGAYTVEKYFSIMPM
jgi:hypothetical protein